MWDDANDDGKLFFSATMHGWIIICASKSISSKWAFMKSERAMFTFRWFKRSDRDSGFKRQQMLRKY